MRITSVVLAAAAALTLAACDDDEAVNVQPTPASVSITVSAQGPITSLTDTRTLTATVTDAGQRPIQNAAVTWSVDNAGVASLSGTSGASVTATAVANGTATVTATSGNARGTTQLTVAQRFATLALAPATALVAVGRTQQLTATARDARAQAIPNVTGVTFSSSNQSIATVNAAGLVTGVAPGTATITAALTRDGVSGNATAAVTVTSAPPPSSVTVAAGAASNDFTPQQAEVAVGGTVTWTFGARPHNVTFRPGTTGAPENVPTTTNGQASRTFQTAGSFPYDCTIHPGMTGTIVAR